MSGDIKGLTVELGGDTGPLEAALKGLGRQTSTINKELGQVERALKFDPTNTVLLGQKQELLAEKIRTTRERLDALRQAQERVDAMYASGEIDDGQYRAFQRDIVTTENKLETFEGQLREVERQQGETGTAAGKMATDIDKAADKSEKSGGKFGKLTSALGGLAKAGAAAAAAAGAAIVAGLGMAGKAALDNADELQRLSDATGISAQELGALQYAGANLGVELDTIAGAQAKLTKSMDAAREGTGSQAEAFEKLGISVTDSNGQLRNAKDVMAQAFEALNGVGNETERDAIAMALFGRSAQDLNPLITAGSDELARLTEEAKTSGAAMSNEAVAGLDTFGDTLDNIKNTVIGQFGEAISGLMPTIQPFLDMLTGADGAPVIGDFIPPQILEQLLGLKTSVDDFSANTAPKIKAWFDEFIGPTAEKVGAAFSDMANEIIPTVTAIVDFVNENWPMIQKAIEPVMAAIRDIIGGAMQIVAGIIRTVMAVIQGDWSAAWEGIKTIFKGVFDVIKGTNMGLAISNGFEVVKDIGGWFSDMYAEVKGVVGRLVTYLNEKFAEAKEAIQNLNPFLRHSPSLVDNVLRGVKVIGDAYGGLSGMHIAAPVIAGVTAGFGGTALPTLPVYSGGGDVYNITVDGSRMPTADFNGLLSSIEQARRMLGKG